MRKRKPQSARLTHVAVIGDAAPRGPRFSKRMLLIPALTAGLLVVFFVGRYWLAYGIAAHWESQLDTVPDARAELLVASAARLGRPGIPVLVAALGSSRECVSRAGREWIGRQLRSWENIANHDAQRNVESLAEALADRLDRFDPAGRIEAARLAARLLRWHLDPAVVNRARVTWLCDNVLQTTGYAASAASPPESGTGQPTTPNLPADSNTSTSPSTLADTATDVSSENDDRPLEIPALLQDDSARSRIAFLPGQPTTPNVVPMPIASRRRPRDLAEAWTMRSRRLPSPTPEAPEATFPESQQRVLVPPAAEPEEQPPEPPPKPMSQLDLTECMRRLHGPGLEPLAAEAELKRRGFDPLRLSIARRLYHPDRRMRLQLVRQLPDIPGIGAANWLLALTRDKDDEVRLAAISLLSTAGDPGVLEEIESIARRDPDERIRQQADRLAKRRQMLNR